MSRSPYRPIEVEMRRARTEVLARVDKRGVFAIHRAAVPYAHTLERIEDRVRERGPWVVTHIPTGKLFAGPAFQLSLREAQGVVRGMHRLCSTEALASTGIVGMESVSEARRSMLEAVSDCRERGVSL